MILDGCLECFFSCLVRQQSGLCVFPGRFLAVDLSLDCDAETYGHYHAFALFMVLVYPVGIPAWIAASVWRHRSAICPAVSPEEVSQAQKVLEAEKKGCKLEIPV